MLGLTCSPGGLRPSTISIGGGAAQLSGILGPNTFVLVDARVRQLHPDLTAGAEHLLELDGGEAIKSMGVLEQVLRCIVRSGIDRGGTLVAVGGGTIGDLGGLAAAMYKRGIELVAVPTTLLSMLDSSVGGKTAINLPEGKNLAGQFWPAERVLIDPLLLATLDHEEFTSGLGEAIKMAIGLDSELFDLLERESEAILARVPSALERVIHLAVRAKIRVVEADPLESGERRLLNLGHTLGHALEGHARGNLRHGHAVARGLFFAVAIGQTRGLLAPQQADRCRRLLAAFGFAETPIPPMQDLMQFLARDKKVEGDRLHLVLPCGIGESRTTLVPLADLA